MSLISIQIVCGALIIQPYTIICGLNESSNLSGLYTSIKEGDFGNAIYIPAKYNDFHVSAAVGKNRSIQDSVMMAANVGEVIRLFGNFIQFYLTDGESHSATLDADKPKEDALQILMSSRKTLSLPPPLHLDEDKTMQKKVLFNDLRIIFENLSLGFTQSNMSIGKNVLDDLTNTLWYIDPFINRLKSRGLSHPPLFDHLVGYNDPVRHKHKIPNCKSETVLFHAGKLDTMLTQPWMAGELWQPIQHNVKILCDNLHKYANYLNQSNERVSVNHSLQETVRTNDEKEMILIIFPTPVVKPAVSVRYNALVSHLHQVGDFEYLCLDEYTPSDTRQRRYYIDNIGSGLPYKSVLFKISAGNNLGTHNFLWRVPTDQNEEMVLKKNMSTIGSIKKNMSTYHTRSMRRNFIQKSSLIMNVKTMHARNIYQSLTGDSTASTNAAEFEINTRVQQAIDMEDPEIIMDLREHNKGQPPKYGVFFEHVKEFLEHTVETAVDDRRHGTFTHLATAISVPDLMKQVVAKCPPETPIPSEQWLRLQFAPKNQTSRASLQFTGSLDVKFQVQSRQMRHDHIDMHYASAVFRYLKEMAVKFREQTEFVCMDDKHHCKVGEPGFPVAAVERGRRVIVTQDRVFAVADHDFTKFSVIPSVTMVIDIPETINGSFYRGQVYVGVKSLILEPSSPMRHITEFTRLHEFDDSDQKPILLLYTDGGPDHRLTYLSVQLSLVCLFLCYDYDMLIAARTPPYNSWKNPPERIMSTLNLALQSIGLMRQTQSPLFENGIKSLSGIKKLRDYAASSDERNIEMKETIEPVKVLMTKLFERLSLKDKPFKTFAAANEQEMKDMVEFLERFGDPLDDSTEMKQKDLQKELDKRPRLQEFLKHCSTSRSYIFCLKKCGEEDCGLCNKPRLPPSVFKDLHILPDPVPGTDGHYKSFEEVYGTETSEEHRPSLIASQNSHHGIPFAPSGQTAKTIKRTVNCTECDKPRVVYSKNKLTFPETKILDKVIELYQYNCGSSLQDLQTDNNLTPRINALLDKCFVRKNLTCASIIETAYYSSGVFKDVCSQCGLGDCELDKEVHKYPFCGSCVGKFPTKRSKPSSFKEKMKHKK